MRAILDQRVEERVKMALLNNTSSTTNDISTANNDEDAITIENLPDGNLITAASSIVQKKRGGSNNLELRKNLTAVKDPHQKLAMILEIWDGVPEDKGNLTESARTFFLRTLNPIMTGYQKHCSGNSEKFISKRGTVKHSSFKTKSCAGKTHCGV